MDGNSNGIVPVMPMGGDAYNGNSFMWIFGLLILMGMFNGGWGGFGNGNAAAALGFENLATSNEVQRGFEAQTSEGNQREILSAVTAGSAASIAATNQTFHDTIDALQNRYAEIQRDIATLSVGQANALAQQNACCSETKLLVQGKAADTEAQIAQSKYDTSTQMAQMEQRIMSKMDANKIEELQNQVNALQLAQATNGVLRFPNSWAYGAGQFPPIFGCCGNNNI